MARKSILPRSRTSRVGQRREYLHRRCRGTYIWNGVSVRSSISFDGGRSLNAMSRALYRVVWPWAQKISTDGKYSLWQTYTASGNLQRLEVWIRELDGRATKRERNQWALPFYWAQEKFTVKVPEVRSWTSNPPTSSWKRSYFDPKHNSTESSLLDTHCYGTKISMCINSGDFLVEQCTCRYAIRQMLLHQYTYKRRTRTSLG